MAKRNKKVAKRPNQRVRGYATRTAGGVMLDAAAKEHIKMMADPCQGRLVPPAYAQPGGGAIIRLKAVVQIGIATGETSGVFHWLPGRNEYYSNGAASATTSFTPSAASLFPVLTYASGTGNSAPSFRCAAACARVMTNASEMNRAGYIWAGQTTNSFYGANSGSAANTQGVAAGLPVMARVPAKFLEVLWVPNENDQAFSTDSTGSGVGIDSNSINHSAITIAVSGLPAATGVSLELTAVYEVNYASTSGYVTSTPSPVTTTPWSHVLKGFYSAIHNAPVIVDTARRALEYMGAAASSQPGRLVAGAARLALTM